MRVYCYLVRPLLVAAAVGALVCGAQANPVAVYWYDDIEGDVSGYTTVDFTATAAPHFHVDSYLAYEGDYSWWCGTFDYDADGGYGNSWDDRLVLPDVYLSSPVQNMSWGAVKAAFLDDDGPPGPAARRSVYPVFTYAFRHDSEPGYDYTYVQVESSGVYIDLNRGYDGAQPWTDLGVMGFLMVNYGDPLKIRFRFISDGAWSDEDGFYPSNGGAFQADNIMVFDYFSGEVYFFDDVESGGLCTPDVPGAAGDFWHVIDRACPAFSDPHSWWCGDDADTSLVPPNLQNGLYSPLIDITGATACTVHFAMHFAIPTIDNDYLSMYGTSNGVDYYSIGGWWGDFGSCDGWGGTAYNVGFDITQFGDPHTWGGFLWVMNTTDNGCGPGGGGDAGAMIDDVLFTSGGGYRDPFSGVKLEAPTDKFFPEQRYGAYR